MSTRAIVLAVTVFAGCLLIADGLFSLWASNRIETPAAQWHRLRELAPHAPGDIADSVRAAYDRAPALVVVLGALLVVPLAALGGLAAETARRRRASREEQVRAASRSPAAEADVTPWPARGWLHLEGADSPAQPIAGPLVRIGRHDDNDILIAVPSVHRHHAVIQHSDDSGFIITDMSGEGGNGVLINGERLRRARLHDGDLIELGEARLTFESVPL